MTQNPENPQSLLEKLRTQTGLTQIEFAQACKIPYRTYQRWAYGQTEFAPTAPQFAAMCEVCKLSPIALLNQLGVDISRIPKR